MDTASTPVLLLLNLPPSAITGIDLLAFTTTPRFRGIKNLLSGIHFTFAASTAEYSERHGLWFVVPDRDTDGRLPLIVSKWDPQTETLVAETEPAELLRWRANVGSLWRDGLLTPYRQSIPSSTSGEHTEESSDWTILASSITPALLSRITGGNTNSWTLSSASSSARDLEDIPGLVESDMTLQADKELRFLPIDLKQTWREGATGRERTDAARDRSWALENLIEHACCDQDSSEIIGELQFCFLMVLTLNNFSCLEQWKRILTFIFTCKAAITKRSDLFIAAIAALRLQLQHCKDAEGGLIDLADEGGSLLRHLLVQFRKGMEGLTGTGPQDVADELDNLEEYLNREHGWQFGGTFARAGVLEMADEEQGGMNAKTLDEDDEMGEFAPQVVELTAEQAQYLDLENTQSMHAGLRRSQLGNQNERNRDTLDSEEEGLKNASDESEDDRDLEDMDDRF